MTHSELRTMVRAFTSYDLDAYDTDFQSNDTKVTAVLNWALRSISSRLNLFNPSVAFTPVAGTGSYSLRGTAFGKRLLEVHTVQINKEPLRDYRGRIGVMPFSELTLHYPLFRSQANGKPIACAVDGDTLVFDKPFDSTTITAANISVAGRVLAADLSGPSDIPEIPAEAHEAIALLATVKAATPIATEQEGWERLKAYSQAQADLIDTLAGRQIATIGGVN